MDLGEDAALLKQVLFRQGFRRRGGCLAGGHQLRVFGQVDLGQAFGLHLLPGAAKEILDQGLGVLLLGQFMLGGRGDTHGCADEQDLLKLDVKGCLVHAGQEVGLNLVFKDFAGVLPPQRPPGAGKGLLARSVGGQATEEAVLLGVQLRLSKHHLKPQSCLGGVSRQFQQSGGQDGVVDVRHREHLRLN